MRYNHLVIIWRNEWTWMDGTTVITTGLYKKDIIAIAIELHLSCTNPSLCILTNALTHWSYIFLALTHHYVFPQMKDEGHMEINKILTASIIKHLSYISFTVSLKKYPCSLHFNTWFQNFKFDSCHLFGSLQQTPESNHILIIAGKPMECLSMSSIKIPTYLERNYESVRHV